MYKQQNNENSSQEVQHSVKLPLQGSMSQVQNGVVCILCTSSIMAKTKERSKTLADKTLYWKVADVARAIHVKSYSLTSTNLSQRYEK